MDGGLLGSSVHGILWARILGFHSLLQGIFLTQGMESTLQADSLPFEPPEKHGTSP